MDELKGAGNKAYLAGKDAEAENLYTRAIDCCQTVSAAGVTSELHVLHSNRSAARLRQKKVVSAIEDAEEALCLQPRYAKAWGRKAAALLQLQQAEEARAAALQGISIDPDSRELQKLLDAAEQAARAISGAEASSTAEPIGLRARPVCHSGLRRVHPREEWFPPPLRRRWIYSPSADGHDENLLVVFHGLGDTPGSFSKLAQKIALPHTASLALAGPLIIPETDGGAAWFTAFDEHWELIEGVPGEHRRLNSLELTRKMLQQLLEALSSYGGWKPSTISLFGFSQGGTMALELALHSRGSWKLGGCVSIAGALLPESLPLDVQELKSKGDCCKGLITHGELDKVVPRSLVINSVKELQESGFQVRWHEVRRKGHAMIGSDQEMTILMAFWAETLTRAAPTAASGEEVVEIHGSTDVDAILQSQLQQGTSMKEARRQA